MKCLIAVAVTSILLNLSGCAAEIKREPVTFVRTSSAVSLIQLKSSADLALEVGGSKAIVAGSRWRLVGSVPMGKVYRSEDSVLTLNSRNAHEAYLVIDGDSVVGFYLPGEQSWVAIKGKALVTYQDVK